MPGQDVAIAWFSYAAAHPVNWKKRKKNDDYSSDIKVDELSLGVWIFITQKVPLLNLKNNSTQAVIFYHKLTQSTPEYCWTSLNGKFHFPSLIVVVVVVYCNVKDTNKQTPKRLILRINNYTYVSPLTAHRCRKSKKNCGNDFIKPSHEVFTPWMVKGIHPLEWSRIKFIPQFFYFSGNPFPIKNLQ